MNQLGRIAVSAVAATAVTCGLIACGGGASTSTARQSGEKDSQQTKGAAKTQNTAQASAQSAACHPHYIEGTTGDEVAESVSSLYDCLVSEQVAGVPSELEEYARYILGAREFAANEFTHMSTILTLSQALQGIYAQNPGATFHMSLGCQSVGGNEDFQTIAFGETQTNEGLEESEANGEATEYTRYIIIPTTPKVAGFSGGGGNRIWVIEDEAALGEEGETYPTEGSCQRPLEWHGPLDPTDADDSLPSV